MPYQSFSQVAETVPTNLACVAIVMESQSKQWQVVPEGPKHIVPFLIESSLVLQLVSEPLVKSRYYPHLPYIYSTSSVNQLGA